jgi:hypothetical protein
MICAVANPTAKGHGRAKRLWLVKCDERQLQETIMRASEYSASHLSARATSGRHLDIRYDPIANAIVFLEDDWSADARGATQRSTFREQLETPKIRRLPRRAA